MNLAKIKVDEAFDFVMHFRNMFYHLAMVGCMRPYQAKTTRETSIVDECELSELSLRAYE
jgi:uncharacterized radical SAM superfamily protein